MSGTLSKRTQSLASQLAAVRAGPSSSVVLPRSLKAIELTYQKRGRDFGARHFTKNHLPAIKYANPWVEVSQTRPQNVDKPAMVLRWDSGDISTVRIRQKRDDVILEELKELLVQYKRNPASVAVKPAPEEAEEGTDSPASSPQAEPMSEPPEGDPTKSGQASGEGEVSSSVEAGVDNGTARQ